MSKLVKLEDVIDVLSHMYVSEDGNHVWREYRNDSLDKIIEKLKDSFAETNFAKDIIDYCEKGIVPVVDDNLYTKGWNDSIEVIVKQLKLVFELE